MEKIIKLTIALLLSIFMFSCTESKEKTKVTAQNKVIADTVVGSKDVTNEIPGSDYIKWARSYFLIAGKDTSDFECILTEYKDTFNIGANMNIRYEKRTLSYRQRMAELTRILPVAAKDFTLNSLKSISIGRLILSGDLAITITKEYIQKFGANDKATDNKKITAFLLASTLNTDFNTLLKPYSITVNKIYVENVFFTAKKELYSYGKVETDSSQIPDKILDGIISLEL